LYNEIISRYANDGNIEGIKNATKLIDKALKMANNALISLKTEEKSNLQKVDLSEVVENAVELSKVYLLDKNIDLQVEKEDNTRALADVEKLTAVIINLIKNASEAFGEEVQENGKYIKIKVDKTENYSAILVSNNAKGIENPDKIFNEGFTTKSSGSGLGLWICKRSIEEQNGELELTRSTEDYTEFTIKLGKGE
jgi:signal transduction histidine kinase